MTPQPAHQVVEEITGHLTSKLRGIPGVTVNAIANLVFGWIRALQPEVLEHISCTEVVPIIEGKTK